MSRFFRISVIALLVLAAGVCVAGQFTVTPVRIYMTPKDRSIAVTVSNEGEVPIVMQAEVFAWGQNADGSENLTPTEDVVMTPPIMTVPPRSRQVVRLARTGPPPVGEQQTYRLLVREVPEVGPKRDEIAMQVAVVLSLPIFISPPGVQREVNCAFERVATDVVRVLCENTGNAYAMLTTLSLLDANDEGLASHSGVEYVLPRIKRGFELKAARPILAGPIKFRAKFDDGTSKTFEGKLPE